MIVLDASAAVELLLQTRVGVRVADRALAQEESIHAPHLLDVEIAQLVRRYARSGIISAERGAEALTDLADFPLRRYPHFVLLPRIWELRHSLTAYDAAYLALAEALNAPLVTRDRALVSAAGGVRVELL